MKLQAKVFIGSAALLAVAAYAAQDAAKLEWKPKEGNTLKYRMEMTMDLDMGGQVMNAKFGMINTAVTKKIEGDKITVETAAGDFSLDVDGMDMSAMMGDMNYVSTTIHSLTGELLESRSTAPEEMRSPRIESAFVFLYPNREVRVGESWKRAVAADSAKGVVEGEATFTYRGAESVSDFRTHKIDVTYRETGGQLPLSLTGTVWVDSIDGELVKAEYKMENAQFSEEMPPANAVAVIQRVR